METLPKVSVVMPSLNVAPYIRECLESVVHQTLDNIEIICVDAGSTDGTLDILEEYAARDSRISIIHSPRKSYGYQMNLGMDAAQGQYFAIVETDDYIKTNMYETLCKIADTQNLEVIKADFCIFVGDQDDRKFTYRPMVTHDKSIYKKILDPSVNLDVFKANNVSWSGIYRMSFLRENKIRHNETSGASFQDNGFWFQVFCQAHRVMFYDKPFYMLRRDNPNSSVKSKEKVYCICNEYDYIRHILKKDVELEKKFAPLCAYYRFKNYNWNLNRIGNEFKWEFLQYFASEFRKLRANGELSKVLFTKDEWDKLQNILDDTEHYYYSNICHTIDPISMDLQDLDVSTAKSLLEQRLFEANQKINILNRQIDQIYNSFSYRIGRFITFIPRKLRGGIRCLQEHGWNYTFDRLLFHLHLKRRSTSDINNKRDYKFYKDLLPSQYEAELKRWYKQIMNKDLDLDNPKTFNEKIQWMKLYDCTDLKTQLSDKYLVRDWVASKIGEQYLIPIYGVWDSFDQIDFEQLPKKFVLKANHGCGWNIIVQNKNELDKKIAKKRMDTWMATNFAFKAGLELQYMNISPKIIAEEYLENENDDLYDYKVFCFNGKAESIMYLSNRQHGLRMSFFDLDWNRLPFVYNYPPNKQDIPRPQNLKRMINLAEKLAEGFAHVRVDFYVLNDGSIKFGEMTFTSLSGTCKWSPPEQDCVYGDLIELPPKKPIPQKRF